MPGDKAEESAHSERNERLREQKRVVPDQIGRPSFRHTGREKDREADGQSENEHRIGEKKCGQDRRFLRRSPAG